MKQTLGALIFFFSIDVFAKINVVTTLPDIAEVVRFIGGDQVTVQSLLSGSEDPHYAEARPDFILKVNKADVVCAIGLDLEIGWLPKVLSKSGNAKIQPGGKGFCELGRSVETLNKPSGRIDRSLGDVHAHGNPHFTLSPSKLGESGLEVVKVLSGIDPMNKSLFEENYSRFKKKMSDLEAELQSQVKKVTVMEYHQEFTYFFNAYGLKSVGSLEEKPGVPPSAARIAKMAQVAKENKVNVLYATAATPHKIRERFQELSGVKVKTLPSYVQTQQEPKTIEALQKLLVESLQ